MINEDRDPTLEALASAWKVETVDLTARVAAAIGTTPDDPVVELLHEIRALRREIEGIRHSNAILQTEVTRLRQDLLTTKPVRIAPYAPNENLVRLS